jgi:hypothetical protein
MALVVGKAFAEEAKLRRMIAEKILEFHKTKI